MTSGLKELMGGSVGLAPVHGRSPEGSPVACAAVLGEDCEVLAQEAGAVLRVELEAHRADRANDSATAEGCQDRPVVNLVLELLREERKSFTCCLGEVPECDAFGGRLLSERQGFWSRGRARWWT